MCKKIFLKIKYKSEILEPDKKQQKQSKNYMISGIVNNGIVLFE